MELFVDPTAMPIELFVYRTRSDFESWIEKGATDENSDTMIHVILGEQSTTLVTAGPESETLRLGLRSATPSCSGASSSTSALRISPRRHKRARSEDSANCWSSYCCSVRRRIVGSKRFERAG
ncbi:MAG: hypothetical protein KF837_07280 [Labilithrix sp.]|nr:hypothetical protein [Labilithrix sp.]